MIKKIVSTALFAFALTAIATAQRIAFVDVTAILESLPEYQKAQEQLDRTATQWRQEIAQEQDKVKGLYSKYQAEQASARPARLLRQRRSGWVFLMSTSVGWAVC